jgi:hypothetical protein
MLLATQMLLFFIHFVPRESAVLEDGLTIHLSIAGITGIFPNMRINVEFII